MYRIVQAVQLNSEVAKLVIEAPDIAAKAAPGQFIILRIDEFGERVPFTICVADKQAGTITIVFQIIGATTMRLAQLRAGQSLLDFFGPLGNPTDFGDASHVCVVGGGLGTAIAYPEAKWLYEHGIPVDIIVGFRSKDIIMLERECKAVCDNFIVMTDDGSNGNKGFVTVPLQRNIDEGAAYDLVIAIGPPPMMRNVCRVTQAVPIKTIVSLNPIMIDGTGMCGGCRVKVGGKILHACVDGPDFDGHLVDWDSVMQRGRMYRGPEQIAREALRIPQKPVSVGTKAAGSSEMMMNGTA